MIVEPLEERRLLTTLYSETFTGAELAQQVTLGNASYPAADVTTVVGSRLDLSPVAFGGDPAVVLYRLPILSAGALNGFEDLVVTVTVDKQAFTADNDLGIAISDGSRALGGNQGDQPVNWSMDSPDVGTLLVGENYAPNATLATTALMTYVINAADLVGTSTVQATNSSSSSVTHVGLSAIDYGNALDFLLVGNDGGELYGVNSVSILVEATSPTVDTTTTVTAAAATYDGLPHGATAVITPGSPAGITAFHYTSTGGYDSSDAPTNAGTYHVVATFTPDDLGAYNPSSGEADFTIETAAISLTIGDATHVYGSTVNLATALGATIDTGVNGENLAIAYSSTGNTVLANAGSYDITGVVADGTGLASNYTVTLTPGTLTVTQATLTGNATTQDALNMAKQGLLKITVSNVAGLVNGDTLASFLSTAEYFITVGSNRYEFVPTTVTTSGSGITISYSLKNSALQSQLAAELADNTSGSTAVTAGFAIESQNYTFLDESLTRLFSTVK